MLLKKSKVSENNAKCIEIPSLVIVHKIQCFIIILIIITICIVVLNNLHISTRTINWCIVNSKHILLYFR